MFPPLTLNVQSTFMANKESIAEIKHVRWYASNVTPGWVTTMRPAHAHHHSFTHTDWLSERQSYWGKKGLSKVFLQSRQEVKNITAPTPVQNPKLYLLWWITTNSNTFLHFRSCNQKMFDVCQKDDNRWSTAAQNVWQQIFFFFFWIHFIIYRLIALACVCEFNTLFRGYVCPARWAFFFSYYSAPGSKVCQITSR